MHTSEKIIGIIPARYASTRFPGKPLADIAGKSMIQRVYEQASKAPSLSSVVVATDDTRIAEHVAAFGGTVVMTSASHQSGTDRCAEVLGTTNGYGIAVNIQGDEPFIDPAQIELLVSCFHTDRTQIATLIKRINTTDELFNTNTPKVVINHHKEALYFSRTTIPFQRKAEQKNWLNHHTYYKHIGIYGYRNHILQEITRLPISALEQTETLEQLRWLENGYRIQTAETTMDTHAVDIPEDVEKVTKAFSR